MKVRNSMTLGFFAALASTAVFGAKPASVDIIEEIVVTAPYPAHLLMEEIVVTAPRPVNLFTGETQERVDTASKLVQRPTVTLAL